MNVKQWLLPLLITLLILLAGVFGIYKVYNQWKQMEIKINQPFVSKHHNDQSSVGLKEIIHESQKHVVQIESHVGEKVITGSGFLYNDQGDIVTNAHVIKDASIIYVKTAHAHIYPAYPLGIGRDVDIALIRVPQLKRQSYLEVEDEITPEIGDSILALGSPHGFQNTVTIGIISGMERNFSVDGFTYHNVYQISAQIAHGNSGGPLIHLDTGNVIGINSVGTEDGTIGFSIPIEHVIDQIINWTEQNPDDLLDDSNTIDILSSYEPVQLEKDGKYLINYFLEGIEMRDYLISYTLLGSKIQSELSYADFRNLFTHVIQMDYVEEQIEQTDDLFFEITMNFTIQEKQKDEESFQSKGALYTFTIGLENDQLKILKIVNKEDFVE